MRRILPLTIAALLCSAAPAAAQATSTATPNTAGKASRLQFDLDGLAAPVSARLPSALQLTAPGFTADLRAVAKRCSKSRAQLNECPRGSLIGKGVLVVGVTDANGSRDTSIDINVYLGAGKRLLAVAYVFGWQVVPGTLGRSGGLDMKLDPLPTGSNLPGIGLALKRIAFDFGAKRTIKQRKVRRVKGRRKVTTVKRRVQLIHNPRTCDGGSWASSVTLTMQDASVLPLPAPTACSGR